MQNFVKIVNEIQRYFKRMTKILTAGPEIPSGPSGPRGPGIPLSPRFPWAPLLPDSPLIPYEKDNNDDC